MKPIPKRHPRRLHRRYLLIVTWHQKPVALRVGCRDSWTDHRSLPLTPMLTSTQNLYRRLNSYSGQIRSQLNSTVAIWRKELKVALGSRKIWRDRWQMSLRKLPHLWNRSSLVLVLLGCYIPSLNLCKHGQVKIWELWQQRHSAVSGSAP